MSSNPPELHVYRDPPLTGPENMARDEWLLAHGTAAAALRLYGWSAPTLSLGYFQRFADIAVLPPDLRNLPVVRRTTGGGAILHDREITYCLVLRANHPSAAKSPAALYTLVHQAWRQAIQSAGITTELAPDDFPLPTPRTGPFFCFEKPGRTDLLLGTDKVLGSAQRRVGGAVLQHGSLILEKRIRQHPGEAIGIIDVDQVESLCAALVTELCESLRCSPVHREWPAADLDSMSEIRAKYAGVEWTKRF
jgi:lipoate-protein ligase A